MTESLGIMPEDGADLVGKVPSGQFGLYLAKRPDNFPCCFCTRRIDDGEHYMLISARRAHFNCVQRVLVQVVAKRDERGVSEDLQK